MIVLAGVGGMIIVSTLVWRTSAAAFTATTGNPANGWAAGSVVLGADDNGAAMFNVTALNPGSTGQRCITVSYTGTVAATVKLYGSTVSGALAPYLDLIVEEGSTGTFASCGAFSATATPYTGTLSDLGSTSTDFASGVGTFAPTGSGQSKVYRITYTLNSTTPDTAEGTTATATFVWEAQNSS